MGCELLHQHPKFYATQTTLDIYVSPVPHEAAGDPKIEMVAEKFFMMWIKVPANQSRAICELIKCNASSLALFMQILHASNAVLDAASVCKMTSFHSAQAMLFIGAGNP